MIAAIFSTCILFFSFNKNKMDAGERCSFLLVAYATSLCLLGFTIISMSLFLNLRVSFATTIAYVALLILSLLLLKFKNKAEIYDDLKKLSTSFIKIPFEIKFMLMVILISSIGPITHADAIDYHVGHPYKAVFLDFLKNDGSHSFGWMGFIDWGNVFLF